MELCMNVTQVSSGRGGARSDSPFEIVLLDLVYGYGRVDFVIDSGAFGHYLLGEWIINNF